MFITWIDGDDKYAINIGDLREYTHKDGEDAEILISSSPSQTVTPCAEAVEFIEAMLFDGDMIANLPVEIRNWPGGVRAYRVKNGTDCSLVRLMCSDLNDLKDGMNYPEGTTS
jgi:hypothetical protein